MARKSGSNYNRNSYKSSKSVNRRKSAPVKRASVNRAPRKRTAPPQNRSTKARPPQPKRSPVFNFVIVFLIVGIVFLVGLVSFNLYKEYRKGQPFTYSDGVNVSGIDIGRLSVKEARAKLEENALNAVRDISIKVKAGNVEKTFSKADFKYDFDYETPLKEAKIYSMKEQGIYDKKKSKAETETEESTDSPHFTLTYKVIPKSVKAQTATIAKKVNSAAKNAKVTKFHPFAEKRFEYQAGVDGRKLDSKTVNKKILDFFPTGKQNLEINARINKLTPSITVKDLQTKIIGLATASTVSQNTPEGTHNMEVALKSCNGSVIAPGATWSFNDCTGDSNLESNGYKKAAVISEKKIKQGVGGGICQASTIIFEAGLFSNMEIIERHNHHWASTYAYAGEDATIDYPDLDLRMRNKTEYQMFIECRMEDGNRLRVNIWGYQDPDYDNIRIHSENYDVTKTDFRTRTFRELFKDGHIIKTETVCDSYYSIKHSIKTPDAETYRTRVDGYVQYEDEDYIPMDTGESESVEEEDNSDDSGEESVEEDYSDEEDTDEEYDEGSIN